MKRHERIAFTVALVAGLLLPPATLCAAPDAPAGPAEKSPSPAPTPPPAEGDTTAAPDEGAAPQKAAIASFTLEEIAALSKRVTPDVERIRGAKFLQRVPVEKVDDAKAQEHFRMRVEKFWPANRLLRQQTAFTLLGLLPPGVDLLRTVMDVLEEQAGGYYDPEKNTFFILDDMPRSIAPVLMAHELTHALDDQRFDIDGMLDRIQDDDDRSEAFGAVVEGSGTLVMTIYTVEQIQSGALPASALQELESSEAGQARKLRAAPALLQRQLIGAYVLGQKFLLRGDISRLAEGAPAADIDRAFRTPPVSSEQILHPEKYWTDGSPDLPRAIPKIQLATALGPGWKRLDGGTLGELALASLTETMPADLLSPAAALGTGWTNDAATGWGGDAWSLFGKDDSRLATLATLWDTPKDAEEFAAALKPLPGRTVARRGSAVVLLATAEPLVTGKLDTIADAMLTALAGAAKGSDESATAAAGSSGSPGKAAGGETKCPDPSTEVVCVQIYAPVVCKGCRYPNGCVAKAAGFDVEKDCAKAPPAD